MANPLCTFAKKQYTFILALCKAVRLSSLLDSEDLYAFILVSRRDHVSCVFSLVFAYK
jgi:hypothetical protein